MSTIAGPDAARIGRLKMSAPRYSYQLTISNCTSWIRLTVRLREHDVAPTGAAIILADSAALRRTLGQQPGHRRNPRLSCLVRRVMNARPSRHISTTVGLPRPRRSHGLGSAHNSRIKTLAGCHVVGCVRHLLPAPPSCHGKPCSATRIGTPGGPVGRAGSARLHRQPSPRRLRPARGVAETIPGTPDRQHGSRRCRRATRDLRRGVRPSRFLAY